MKKDISFHDYYGMETPKSEDWARGRGGKKELRGWHGDSGIESDEKSDTEKAVEEAVRGFADYTDERIRYDGDLWELLEAYLKSRKEKQSDR